MSASQDTLPFVYASDELDAMASASNYYDWITDRFKPFLGERILEVGAGIGTYSGHLLAAQPAGRLTLLEPAGNNYPRLAARFKNDERVSAVHGELGEDVQSASVDSVVAVNVMEHVEDDADFLRHATRVLVPGGHLLLFVPAVKAIYGALDRALEHHRRYGRDELRGRIEAAGLQVISLRYTNLPGILAWWLVGQVMGRTSVTPAQVRTYDRLMIPWLRRLESFWSPPLGQSLVVVARKPGTPVAQPGK